MSSFALVAEFPLGTYRAHVGDGDLDLLPSIARLHAALLCAAAAGPSARPEPKGEGLAPDPAAQAALEWLEAHPPDGICLPDRLPNRGPTIAYRDLGLLERRRGKPLTRKRLPRPVIESVSLSGALAWIWEEEEPPAEVRATLEHLCGDVSHLGSAESPVRLRVGEMTPTHRRDDGADLFGDRGIDLATPSTGRTEALSRVEADRRRPVRGSEQPGTTESELSSPDEQRCVTTARFRPELRTEPESPWSSVLLVPLDAEIPPGCRVRWAVQAHRALVSLVGSGAPAVLTGTYPEGASRPANRVAIHVLGRETLADRVLETPATLAVLVPANATASDVEVIARATAELRLLRGPAGKLAKRAGTPFAMPGATFWPAVPAGRTRLWLTVPAAVPDTRPLRRDAWTMEDAIALSLGLVWRERFEPGERGPRWQVGLATAAKAQGVRVEQVRMVTRGDPTRFVHRVNPGAVVRPYEAIVDLGELAAPQALLAIGQARHLGGGLLYPIDLPDGALVRS